jgi:HlyD family secretion protein
LTKTVPEKKNHYRRAIPWLVGSGLLGVTLMGGWVGYKKYFYQTPQPISVNLHSVKKGTVETTVTASGTVELGGQQTLKSPKEITVEQVKIKEGDRVYKGQTLIVLRDRAAIESYQEQLVENAKTQLDLNRRREQVAEARKQLKVKEARYREFQQWQQKGVISRTELRTDRDNFEQARSQLKDAQLEEKKAELDVRNGQEKLKRLQQQLGDRLVIAPTNGIVLKVYVKNGDGTKTESNLLTLGDPSQEIIRVQLTTLNALQVKINQTAKIGIIGPKSQAFTGRIISLSPQATVPNTNANSSTSSETSSGSNAPTKVDTKVVLDRPSNTLIPGSVVSVEIVTARRQNVIAIPPEAIQRTEIQPFVWIQNSKGKAKKQPIAIGLEGLQQVEVTSGLQAGNKLVIAPSDLSLTPETPLIAR